MCTALHARPIRANRLSTGSIVRFGFVFVVALLTGCLKHSPRTLGTEFDGNSVPVANARRLDPGSRVIVQGIMTEKCPEAGCWFMLRDETGVIRVDTKDAGFVVVDVPLQVSVTVAGRMEKNGGGDGILKATGLRY
jgi:uncharacterized protein YdeI (BOF family)